MEKLLRIILFLIGSVIIWLGLDVGLGGMNTLGWQGETNFFEVTNPEVFAIRDSHLRFIAGVWMAVGLLMIAGAFALRSMRSILIALMAMVFVGGLMRFSSGDPSLFLSSDIAPSLFGELLLFPLLGFWVHRATNGPSHA